MGREHAGGRARGMALLAIVLAGTSSAGCLQRNLAIDELGRLAARTHENETYRVGAARMRRFHDPRLDPVYVDGTLELGIAWSCRRGGERRAIPVEAPDLRRAVAACERDTDALCSCAREDARVARPTGYALATARDPGWLLGDPTLAPDAPQLAVRHRLIGGGAFTFLAAWTTTWAFGTIPVAEGLDGWAFTYLPVAGPLVIGEAIGDPSLWVVCAVSAIVQGAGLVMVIVGLLDRRPVPPGTLVTF